MENEIAKPVGTLNYMLGDGYFNVYIGNAFLLIALEIIVVQYNINNINVNLQMILFSEYYIVL